MLNQRARTDAKQRSERASTDAAPSSTGGGAPPSRPGPAFVAEGLGNAARRARFGQYRSLALAALLTLVAAGAVLAGTIADSEAFWGAAGGVFLVAFMCLVAWTADQLGSLAGTLGLLRAALKLESSDEPRSQVSDGPTESEVAFGLGKTLRDDGHHEAAEHAFLLAANDGHADACFALGFAHEKRAEVREAAGWYLAAARQGHRAASYRLARIHHANGPDDGIDVDTYKQATEQGSPVAAYVLGRRDGEADVPLPSRDELPESNARRKARRGAERRRERILDDQV